MAVASQMIGKNISKIEHKEQFTEVQISFWFSKLYKEET